MLPVKLPYYPKVQAYLTETRFGTKMIDHPTIYDSPLPGKFILKVDTLNSIEDLVGYECFMCRDLMLNILAGECKDDYNELVASFYTRFPKFRAYMNESYSFGDNDTPIIDRAILPLRRMVDEYSTAMMQTLHDMGGKYLLRTHDYLYYAFNVKPDIKALKGATIIC